ncbi:transposable element Tcb2 transposase [Trichonephila clavipes]|nr:transposable element Tcb2 transposase [Trichonephila clavipes]
MIMDSWLMFHELEPNATEDIQSREADVRFTCRGSKSSSWRILEIRKVGSISDVTLIIWPWSKIPKTMIKRPDSGCPQQTSRREDRHIVRNARVQPTASQDAIQAQLAPSLWAPLLHPYEGTWLKMIWDRGALYVVFSNESRFNLSSDDNHVRVWTTRVELRNLAFALQLHTTLTAGVMVWKAIASNTWSPVVLIRDTMTSCNHMCCNSYNGSQKPFFNTTIIGLI